MSNNISNPPVLVPTPAMLQKEKKGTEEGILQVEKSFKKQYGTFEIRLEIRKRRLAGDSWGKIKKQFADAYDENALKTIENK